MTEPKVELERTGRAWAVLAVVTGALFLEGIDIAMLNVAVPSIAADIGLSTGSAHWVISAYVLAYAGFMILGGRVADVLGRRRVFLAALTVFIGFSVLGGLAQESSVLIAARFITGATAGFMTPAGFSLLTTSFSEGALRNKALAIYGAVGASGFLLGVVAGGVLTSWGWRTVFFAPAVLGSIFLIAGAVFIPREEIDRIRGRFDVGGAALLTAAMVSLVYGIVSLGESVSNAAGLGSIVLAIALLGAFLLVERRVADPLIPSGVVTSGLLPWVTSVGLLFIGAFFAWQFVLTLYLQELLGWSPLHTGLAFAAMGIEVVIAPVLTPRLVERFGNIAVMITGLVAVAVGFLLSLRLDATSGFADLLPSLLLLGVAFAFIYGPLTSASVEGVEESMHGVAGGIVYTGFQFGAALGISLATMVLVAGGHSTPGIDDYRRALIVPAVAAGSALLVGVFTMLRHRARKSVAGAGECTLACPV
ncbi:MFS transporter [Rhodococcus sp. EPR-157]|uniref:MFS transporter n=1 Tax=Rhodococcus sp. EPR-157 TaxID=1813677 RepID=UPI0007BB9B94|nr:MFS transporter [Rhodococcus sp. EPR-157]KZF09513.1 MFS transporter [Rhodococcus sp. EPR-157]